MFSLLNRCARLELQGQQQFELARLCQSFRQWDDLLICAEKQGMAPLLHKHLVEFEISVPAPFSRGLRFLSLRHKRANTIRLEILSDILALLEQKGIPSLTLKGAALCQTLYPDAGLRPMRDIDLFLDPEDVHHVHGLLQQHGFRVDQSCLPEHYYHLAPLIQNVDGMEVCLELHLGLFPSEPPYYQSPSFKTFFERATSFSMAGLTAFCLNDEDMLWHLFQHGLHAPLTYEPYKLISVADIISLVEARVEVIRWDRIEEMYPQLLKSLPLFHYLNTWSNEVLTKIPPLPDVVPSRVGQAYMGWPYNVNSGAGKRGWWRVLRETLWPGDWWQMLYYSTGSGRAAILHCRLLRHPLHILRWVKIRIRSLLRAIIR